MTETSQSDWVKLPGLFRHTELQGGAVPMEPVFEYLVLADGRDGRGQALFAVYFRERPSPEECE